MPAVLLAANNSNHPCPDALKFERIFNVNFKYQRDRLKED